MFRLYDAAPALLAMRNDHCAVLQLLYMSKGGMFASLQENDRVIVDAHSHRPRFTRSPFYCTACNDTRVRERCNTGYFHLVSLLLKHLDKIRRLVMRLLSGILFRPLSISGRTLFLPGRVFKQSIVVALWNRHMQRMWHSIKAIGYHDMLFVLLLVECFTI